MHSPLYHSTSFTIALPGQDWGRSKAMAMWAMVGMDLLYSRGRHCWELDTPLSWHSTKHQEVSRQERNSGSHWNNGGEGEQKDEFSGKCIKFLTLRESEFPSQSQTSQNHDLNCIQHVQSLCVSLSHLTHSWGRVNEIMSIHHACFLTPVYEERWW